MLIITPSDYPAYTSLITQLTDLNYLRLPIVTSPGEFAVRGSLIDVFGVNQSHPIRLEYDHTGKLDRLYSFQITTQRALSPITTAQFPAVDHQRDELDIAATLDADIDHLLSDIDTGDYVVHELYGIGQFMGMHRLTFGGREGEFLFVRYRGEDKLYVPLDQLHLLHRYSPPDITPHLHSLSDGQWQKTRKKISRELETLAQDVYLITKKRATIAGFSCKTDTPNQAKMEAKFDFTPTPDQTRSIIEIKQDMERPYPMDRVLCGDVGYGKTEVLIRAAFKMCENGKQVAVLVPTTLLASQHELVFRKRFEGFEHKIACLSRFKSKKEQADILEKVASGDILVLIGTHRIVQDDVTFPDLGLLIIDEEQRFGVTHKEKWKKQFPAVDVLSVSATPIPRTLYMSLTGARDFSTLQTPPVARKPIMTHVGPLKDDLVIAATTRELDRNGQVYYMFNHVRQMPQKAAKLQKLLPNARIAIAHGQLPEHKLEEIIDNFINHHYDMLLCSSIIENGLDMPRVNTIIIDSADHLGLSQIHQLRGRVGRRDIQGYALILHPQQELTENATRRLTAIKEYAALGAGYKLAMRDLEIRGAGTLLGKRQHGHLTAIGFELYCQLLSDAVAKQNGQKITRKSPLQLKPDQQTYIPDTYIDDSRQRLAIYQRLTILRYRYELDDLQDELTDRYGPIPKSVRSFLDLIWQQLI